jgi:hypothetical protein
LVAEKEELCHWRRGFLPTCRLESMPPECISSRLAISQQGYGLISPGLSSRPELPSYHRGKYWEPQPLAYHCHPGCTSQISECWWVMESEPLVPAAVEARPCCGFTGFVFTCWWQGR